jgi:hypothetical protein
VYLNRRNYKLLRREDRDYALKKIPALKITLKNVMGNVLVFMYLGASLNVTYPSFWKLWYPMS